LCEAETVGSFFGQEYFLPTQPERTGGEVVEIFLINLGSIGIRRWGIGFWGVPENLTEILPDKKGAAGDDCTLVLHPDGKPVDMLVAEMTDNKDTGRGIPFHLPVTAPGDPVDLKEREREVFRAEFAVPLNGKFELFFLHRCQSGIFGHLHNTSHPGDPFIKDMISHLIGKFFDRVLHESRYPAGEGCEDEKNGSAFSEDRFTPPFSLSKSDDLSAVEDRSEKFSKLHWK